jgi:hypothetical protein
VCKKFLGILVGYSIDNPTGYCRKKWGGYTKPTKNLHTRNRVTGSFLAMRLEIVLVLIYNAQRKSSRSVMNKITPKLSEAVEKANNRLDVGILGVKSLFTMLTVLAEPIWQ